MGSEQQFCLRWNNHQSNLLSVFDNLLQNETLVDVTLACDGLSLKAHKVVLSACSPYFQHLFMDNPCKHPIVILKDIGYTDMKTLIDFMYKGEVNVSHDQLSTLLRVADTLKVKGLAEVTENMAARECDPVSRRQTEGSVPEAKHKSSFSRVGKSTGNLSPPPKRRKKRRSSGGSAGHSDDVDSHGPKDASSRSSTPVEIPIVPKSEVVDMSYDGPDKTLCSVTEDSLPLMNATNSSQHVSMAHEAAIMPHPLSNKDSTEVSQKFELPGEELDTDMPFTQHLAVGSDGTPPSPGAHPSTSSSSHVDQSSYFPPSSSLNLANVASASCPSTSRSASTQGRSAQSEARRLRNMAKLGERLTDDNFRQALQAICSGSMGYCRAAKVFGVNHATLWRYYRIAGFMPQRAFGQGISTNNSGYSVSGPEGGIEQLDRESENSVYDPTKNEGPVT